MSIVTDSTPLEAPKDPEKCNVFALYKLFAPKEAVEDMAEKYKKGGFGYGHAKKELLQVLEKHFAPYREKYEALKSQPEEVERILEKGAKKAREIARQTVQEVRHFVGMK